MEDEEGDEHSYCLVMVVVSSLKSLMQAEQCTHNTYLTFSDESAGMLAPELVWFLSYKQLKTPVLPDFVRMH